MMASTTHVVEQKIDVEEIARVTQGLMEIVVAYRTVKGDKSDAVYREVQQYTTGNGVRSICKDSASALGEIKGRMTTELELLNKSGVLDSETMEDILELFA